MSAPFIWIIIPGLAGIALFVVRRWRSGLYLAGILLALILAWLAWQLPIGETLQFRLWAGFPALKIGEIFPPFGQRFVLENASRPILIWIYLNTVFWFCGAYAARTDRLFIPTGLVIAALLTAALAVEPIYFAPIFILFIALVSVLILSPPGKRVAPGVFRFLAFQLIGVCMILFADRLLPLIEIDANNPNALPPNMIMIGLGFMLMLAAFPFHSWIPMLSEKADPFPTAFIFYTYLTAVLFLLLELIGYYARLGASPVLTIPLRSISILMVITGGIWAAFERHLGRILGFAAIQQAGTALMAISFTNQANQSASNSGIFFALLLPQALSLALWSLGLCVLRSQSKRLHFQDIAGFARHLPIASSVVVLANFSLAGLPLLASFPVYILLWSAVSQESLSIAIISLIGNVGLFIAGARTLATLVSNSTDNNWQISESGIQTALLLFGAVMLFVVGLMPHWFLPPLADIGFLFLQSAP